GLRAATDYVTRFGFDKASLPNNLTLALGSMDVTPLQVATGYTVFANGGYRVEPYFIDRIEDPKGNVVFRAEPRMVARECDAPTPETTASAGTPSAPSGSDDPNVDAADAEAPLAPPRGCAWPAERIAPRVISAANAWLMTDMMREVITRGTGRRALALGRGDLAGKTGTTNEARDTWFNGFNSDLVASVWVGFDQSRPLGEGEEGSRTAVPIWVSFMREALRTVPERTRPMPPGLVQARISPTTGELAGVDDAGAIFETFLEGHLPVGGVLGGETSAAPGAATEGAGILDRE
ncbi:MAG: peptidase, partial [Gammaproteobacteria bacterium]|nr:peptidase [Gammaproteobacteria bacterium]